MELSLRGKREYTESILAAMGGIDRARFSQLKALLALSDEALEIADRYSIDEYRLRPVLNLPSEVRVEMVQHIIKFNLTGRQIAEMCSKGLNEKSPAVEPDSSPRIKRLVRLLKKIDDNDEADFVRGLLSEEKAIPMARARLDATTEFLLRVKNKLPEE